MIILILRGLNKVTNMDYLFFGCEYLSLIGDIPKSNNYSINNIYTINSNSITLSNDSPETSIKNYSIQNLKKKNLPPEYNITPQIIYNDDFFNDNTETNSNNINQNYISNNKNISKIKDIINNLELGLSNLKDLDTSKVDNFSFMFYKCKSLLYLPDISEWNTENATNISHMFQACITLSWLPDISKWNTKKVTDLNAIFNQCKSLTSLPDISKWDSSNFKNLGGMFSGCEKLRSLPDISKWNTSQNIDMYYIFNECRSLISVLIYQNGILKMLII